MAGGITMVFFTSDLHLGHVNIIRLCNRPFSSMNYPPPNQRFGEGTLAFYLVDANDFKPVPINKIIELFKA